MPLVQARRLVTEIGRIRIGDRQPIQSGKHKGDPRPNKLVKFRLTSNEFRVLEAAAKRYGGTVREWVVPEAWRGKGTTPEDAYELYTESDTLKVLIRASSLQDTTRETWEGGWCVRRCDGAHIFFDAYDKAMVGRPCACPADHEHRKELAARGKACQEYSRILVQIYDLPYGYWRLETKGFFGPAEIRDLQDYLREVHLGSTPIEALLRLEIAKARRIDPSKPEGKQRETLEYPVVRLIPAYSAVELQLRGAEARRQLAEANEPGAGGPVTLPAVAQTISEVYGTIAQTHPLRERITTLLHQQGVTGDGIAEYWAKMARKYPDTDDPTVLSMMYEQLLTAAEQRRRSTPEPLPAEAGMAGAIQLDLSGPVINLDTDEVMDEESGNGG